VTDSLVDAALRFRPGQSRSDVVPLGEGQLAVAFLVDGHVVRVPKSEFARDHLRHEVDVVQRIGPRLDHRLPEFVGGELDGPLSHAFVAHRLLAGAPLTPESAKRLPRKRLSRVAARTGQFLLDLHSLPVDDFPFPRSSIAEFAQSLRDETVRLLRPRMSERAWARADSELGRLATLTTDRLCVCHTDIGGNVLTDADDNVAFIDFGSAMISDPVLDIASLSVLGTRFLEQCAETYPALRDRLDNARLVSATFHLQDALYGARQGDWTYVSDVLGSYA
jgi:aminoglycoside phosphotransferase (APT) family kinase protein